MIGHMGVVLERRCRCRVVTIDFCSGITICSTLIYQALYHAAVVDCLKQYHADDDSDAELDFSAATAPQQSESTSTPAAAEDTNTSSSNYQGDDVYLSDMIT